MSWPLAWRSTLDAERTSATALSLQCESLRYQELEPAQRERDLAIARAARAEELLDAVRAERIVERDLAERRLATEQAERRADREAAAKLYGELMTRFTQLKLQGFTEVAPVAPVEPAPPDLLRQRIIAKAGHRTPLLKQMLRQLDADRADGVDDAEIERRIEDGESVGFDGVPA